MAKKYNLKLKGYVGGWDFDPDYIDWYLDKHKNEELTIVIDSLGGSLISAMSVAASIKMHGNVSVHYVGFNASAATIASMNAKHISIDANAMYLVHRCSQFVCKVANCNADEMADLIAKLDKERRQLEKIDLTVAGMYAARCKKSKEALIKLMSEGGWLTAKEAKEWGFVDEITDEAEEAQPVKLTADVVACMEAEGMPIPDGYGKHKPLLRRMADAWVSMFEDKKNYIFTAMSKLFPLICAALAVEAITVKDGKATMSEDQLEKLENLLAEKDSEITKLQNSVKEKDATIENLKKAPAETTKQVVDEGSKGAVEDSELDDFFVTAKKARETFNLIK